MLNMDQGHLTKAIEAVCSIEDTLAEDPTEAGLQIEGHTGEDTLEEEDTLAEVDTLVEVEAVTEANIWNMIAIREEEDLTEAGDQLVQTRCSRHATIVIAKATFQETVPQKSKCSDCGIVFEHERERSQISW